VPRHRAQHITQSHGCGMCDVLAEKCDQPKPVRCSLPLLTTQARKEDCWSRGISTAGVMAAGSVPVGFFRAHATLKVCKEQQL
jgi:hypothetical protein